MAMSRFQTCLERVLQHEGGWANHPDDPGGATMQGVTQSTYDAWRLKEGLPPRTVRNISRPELESIYLTYWTPGLPVGVDYAVFDAAINSGPARARGWLEQAWRQGDPQSIVVDLCEQRLSFLMSLRGWPVFGRGWERRVSDVERQALSDALAAQSTPEAITFTPQQPSESMWKRILAYLGLA